MYGKFMEVLGEGHPEMKERPVAGGALLEGSLAMEISLPDVLVTLGITKDIEEGKVFVGTLVAGSLLAVATGETDPIAMAHNLMKTGFLLALKGGGGKGVGN
jgi:hypothetical protein